MTEPKFKVGDRFKVVSNVDDEHFDSFVGATGTIAEAVEGADPVLGQFYWVGLDNPDAALGANIYFFESELEKLED